MEENEGAKEKLIEDINVQSQVRNNLISGEQIIPKSFEEKLCCCCLNYDLTVAEFKSFNLLKKKVIPSYNPQNEEHEKTLQELFNKTKELLNNDNNISSEITEITTKESNNDDESEKIWRKIGFQTKEPRTDFRAGGIYSLDLMMYFIKNYEKDYINILNEDYFTFALTCIRVSYLIRTYLYLLTNEEIRINSKFQRGILANRKQLKYFCYFLIDNDNLLNDICCTSLINIYQKFKEEKTGQKEKNYLIIEPIIQNSVQCLQNSLNNSRLNDDFISHLKESYRQNFLNNLT
jgi:hypothetical protein